ncbi:MAG: class I SAM-dependent methyltransferase [Desulfopila sp.]|jgi:ubiquinone/menaquinone biosynthesis C-methylase UbiE|nr:class I SAM-dependent methyltransferase [Desulfopila sp.]
MQATLSTDRFKQGEKYSRNSLLNEKKIRKGSTRWNQLQSALDQIDPALQNGPILDFGCGVGYFVLEGLRRHMDMWGVDILPGKITRYKKLIEYTDSPASWKNRCVIADGEELPFPANSFSAVASWYVFEHIRHPSHVLRELVRVTRKGGVIAIRAQDARNGWEGHCKIPWVPFLSRNLARTWIEAFGKSPHLREGVYDITQPQVISILEQLHCTVVIQAEPPADLIENHWALSTEQEVRETARQIRRKFDEGSWQPQPENLYLFARKDA